MSSIQLISSSYSSNAFGIQSAFWAFTQPSISGTGTLYTQGCNVKETRNCTIACQDPTQIFISPYTLQNCMVLSALVPITWTQSNETTLSLSNWTQPLSTEALTIASEFGIDTTSRDFPSLASNVTQTIKECFEEYNNANAQEDGYETTFSPWYYESSIVGPINQTAMNDSTVPIYKIICPLEVSLNQDIGGIGVSQRCAD